MTDQAENLSTVEKSSSSNDIVSTDPLATPSGDNPVDATTKLEKKKSLDNSSQSIAVGSSGSDIDHRHQHRRRQRLHTTLSKSIVRKYDLRILPLVSASWMLFYLDRAALALANVNGMERDLALTGTQFNVALALFFTFYIVASGPGHLLLRRVGGGRCLPAIIVAWGLVTTFSGFVTSFAGLCVSRVFLGLAESAFLGVVMLYLGFFYTEFELVARVGLFYSGNALAGAFGGFLAAGLGRIRFRGYNGWPWIFFVEGILTVVVGVLAYVVLPNGPEAAPFLTDEEREVAMERMRALDRRHERLAPLVAPVPDPTIKSAERNHETPPQAGNTAQQDRLTWAAFKRAVWNPVTILMALATFLTIQALYSFTTFLPTIIFVMGYSGTRLNLLTVPPNLVAFIFTIAVTQYSQRSGAKAIPMLICSVSSVAGYLLLLVGAHVGVSNGPPGSTPPSTPVFIDRTGFKIQYAGAFLVAIGINTIPPIALAWTCINASPHYVRAIVLTFIITLGNTAAFLSSFTYITSQRPRYITGHSINLGCCVALTATALTLILYMRRENKRREQGDRDDRLVPAAHLSVEEKERFELELGWMHPRHRFQL